MAKDELRRAHTPVWINTDAGNFETFKALVSQTTEAADYPLAAKIAKNVPIYSGDLVRDHADDQTKRRELMSEWVRVFSDGPGVIVIRNAMRDLGVVDEATEVFSRLIEAERDSGGGGGDHFAKPGANDRLWNAAQKHCVAAPENFAAYYACDAIAMASEAWLGPGYQVTAQVNRVNPGGAAQTPHRDYHLGFMPAEQSARYPAHVHGLSPLLTLQGGVAHCDMPVESGPTVILPYSQAFFEGYVAFGRDEYQDYFAEHHVQIGLFKGDAIFFSPAAMHGAGHNETKDVYRMANLLQVGSGFGRSIESVDRTAMCRALYPVLLTGGQNGTGLANIISASAEGYPFPTNLDTDPPVGGLAPKSQATLILEALEAEMSEDDFNAEMDAWEARRRP